MVSSPEGCQRHVRRDSFAGTVFLPGLDRELFLVAERTAQVLCFPSHRGDHITSRPEGCAVAIALASPTLPRHGTCGCPREGLDDVGHRLFARSA